MTKTTHFNSVVKGSFQVKLMAVVFALGLVMNCFAETTDEREELEERIRTVGAKLQELCEGKGAPKAYTEYYELQKKIAEMRRANQEELRKPQQRLSELWQDQKVQKWHSKITKKQNELQQLRSQMQGIIHKRAQDLLDRRNEELAAIATHAAPEARALGFTVLNYPKVDGSTSTQPLGMIIACKMLGSSYQWAPTARYSGRWHTDDPGVSIYEHSPYPGAAIAARSFPRHYYDQFSLTGFRPLAQIPEDASQADIRRNILINRMLTTHAGTHGAYVNVINGDSDIGLVARKPSPDELKLAKEKGVELDVEPIALDAFVFIKNFEAPVESLSIEQIQKIYSGEIKNWKDGGGPDLDINAYRRNRNSGSQELMEKMVMQNVEFEELEHPESRNLIHHGMGGPYIALTHDRRGLAYSVYYYEHFMSGSPQTQPLGINGVVPSYETIQSGEYPLVTEVYVITRKGLTNDSPAAKFKTWLLSPEGQAVVRESGYVPLPESD